MMKFTLMNFIILKMTLNNQGGYFMELIFLGTGAGLPSKERNVSAIALSLLQEINSIWLFDCGEAIQHQILHNSIKPIKINKIIFTILYLNYICKSNVY